MSDPGAHRLSGHFKRPLAIGLSRFAFEALAGGAEEDAERVASRVQLAVRYYLADRDRGRPGWRYPAFLRDREAKEERTLDLRIDDVLWRSFKAEAGSQGVSTQRLVEHAVLYFAADIESGLVTQRILDDLEGEDELAEGA